MAVLDSQHDAVVIRVVYDGPPLAGKTTSVRALALGLGGQVVAPREISGRTLYFDWLDYTGGLFEGRRIRCQIITVPGQAILASRRRHLLQSADVVVFVGDSAPQEQAATASYLAGLHRVLNKLEGPPVGIVLQANKRDLATAVPLQDLHAMVDRIGGRIGVVESVATDGSGIRETFVFAVRLALDRVRELMRLGRLENAPPKIASANDLLAELQRTEGESLALAAQSRLTHTRLHEVSTSPTLGVQALQQAIDDNATPTESCQPAILHTSTCRNGIDTSTHATPARSDTASTAAPASVETIEPPPRIPGHDLPSGRIWPPVHGRLLLHRATANGVLLERHGHGEWTGRLGEPWLMRSTAAEKFSDLHACHAALVAWARIHVASSTFISGERCILMSGDGGGQFRLWQIVHREVSLRDHLDRALRGSAEVVVTQLLTLVDCFLTAAEQFSRAACRLPLSLKNIGVLAGRTCFVGFMPPPVHVRLPDPLCESAIYRLLAMQLESARAELAACRDAALTILDDHANTFPKLTHRSVRSFVRQFIESAQA